MKKYPKILPEGDITLPAEFSTRDRTELVLQQEPAVNTQSNSG